MLGLLGPNGAGKTTAISRSVFEQPRFPSVWSFAVSDVFTQLMNIFEDVLLAKKLPKKALFASILKGLAAPALVFAHRQGQHVDLLKANGI